MINLSKLNKKQLIQTIQFYETQLQILDIMLSDMSQITLETVNNWLDDTTRTAESSYKEFDKPKNKNTYIQLKIGD